MHLRSDVIKSKELALRVSASIEVVLCPVSRLPRPALCRYLLLPKNFSTDAVITPSEVVQYWEAKRMSLVFIGRGRER
jgi:hypothetical protein